MTDAESLVLILAAIYLVECATWMSRLDVVFHAPWGGVASASAWRVRFRDWPIGNQQGAVALANPLPPLGVQIVCRAWPISISPDGVYAYTSHCLDPLGRPWQPREYASFDDAFRATAEGKQLFVNGKRFATLRTHAAAEALADLLANLAKTPEEKRSEMICAQMAASLSVEQIEARLSVARRATGVLRWTCNLLFATVFVGGPALVWAAWTREHWPWLLGMLAGGMLVTWFLFFRAYRALYPVHRGERLKHLALLAVSPPQAIRAHHHLWRDLLDGFHPLAAAMALLAPDAFALFARQILLDLRFPLQPPCPDRAPGPIATEAWCREMHASLIAGWLRDQGLDPDGLLAPPTAESFDSRAYCPRCRAQFASPDGVCASCGGQSLAPL